MRKCLSHILFHLLNVHVVFFLFYLQYVHSFINQTWRERYQTDISQSVLTLLWSTIVSMFTLGGLLGATIGGTLSIKLGRCGPKKIKHILAKSYFSMLYFGYKAVNIMLLFQERDTVGQ